MRSHDYHPRARSRAGFAGGRHPGDARSPCGRRMVANCAGDHRSDRTDHNLDGREDARARHVPADVRSRGLPTRAWRRLAVLSRGPDRLRRARRCRAFPRAAPAESVWILDLPWIVDAELESIRQIADPARESGPVEARAPGD